MDREERLQALNKIEGQLSQYLAADKKNWIQTYLLMSEVQDKELYIVNYRSYTKWVNHLADSLSIHVSTLWARLKAGKNYAEYIRQIVISSTPLYPTILFNLRFNSTKCFPCLIFRAKQP